jgi:intracellular sulfur oxidation DsrE/DsrF family protein
MRTPLFIPASSVRRNSATPARRSAGLRCLALAMLAACAGSVTAADYPAGITTGPAVENYGPVAPVPEGAFALDNSRSYKVVKDIRATAESPDQLNRNLEAVARLLNMQARAGMPAENLDVAVVVHGPAVKDLLSDAAYRERFGQANPNTGLIAGLQKAGVPIYLCGQTVAIRGFSPEELNPSVKLALSAMGAHIRLQSEGYTVLPF